MKFLLKVSKTTLKNKKLMLPKGIMKNAGKWVTLSFPNRKSLRVRLSLSKDDKVWLIDAGELLKHHYICQGSALRFKHLGFSHFKVSVFHGSYDYYPEIKYPNPNHKQTTTSSSSSSSSSEDDSGSSSSSSEDDSRSSSSSSEDYSSSSSSSSEDDDDNQEMDDDDNKDDGSVKTPPCLYKGKSSQRSPDFKCKRKKPVMKNRVKDSNVDDHDRKRMATKERHRMRKEETCNRNRHLSKRNQCKRNQEVEETDLSDGNASPKLKPHYETRNKKIKMEQMDESSQETLEEHKMSCSHEINEFKERETSFESESGKCEEDLEIITSEMFNSTKFSPESKRAIHAARENKPKLPSFMVVLSSYNCYNRALYIPGEFSGRYLSEAPKYIKLKVSNNEREWKVRLRKKCRRMDLGKGITQFFRDNNAKPEDVCVFELIKSNPVVLKASIFHMVQVDTEIITSAMFEFTEVSPETKRAIRAARMYNHKLPSFMVVIRAYHFKSNGLYVPGKFSNRYLRGATKYIKLVAKGKEWIICLKRNHNRFDFGSGWNEFRRDNNLKTGDVCVFVLITYNNVMKASIFHAAEGAGPED